jgi:hypothetical protein
MPDFFVAGQRNLRVFSWTGYGHGQYIHCYLSSGHNAAASGCEQSSQLSVAEFDTLVDGRISRIVTTLDQAQVGARNLGYACIADRGRSAGGFGCRGNGLRRKRSQHSEPHSVGFKQNYRGGLL